MQIMAFTLRHKMFVKPLISSIASDYWFMVSSFSVLATLCLWNALFLFGNSRGMTEQCCSFLDPTLGSAACNPHIWSRVMIGYQFYLDNYKYNRQIITYNIPIIIEKSYFVTFNLNKSQHHRRRPEIPGANSRGTYGLSIFPSKAGRSPLYWDW